MRRAFAVAVLSLALVPAAAVIAPGVASACSCMRSPGPLDAARGVDVVFSAKLVSVADGAGTAQGPGGQHVMPTKIFTFDVTQTYKGQLDAQVRVETADNSAACGRAYGDPGSEWLIYARTTDAGQLSDNLCSRSMALADAADDIEALVANADSLDQPPEPVDPGPGPADPEPEPIDPVDAPAEGGAVDPEPATPSKKGCAVDEPTGLGAVASLALLGLAGLRRRRS